jgi:hypothetical protein
VTAKAKRALQDVGRASITIGVSRRRVMRVQHRASACEDADAGGWDRGALSRPRTTTPGHKIYPYLLRGLEITGPKRFFFGEVARARSPSPSECAATPCELRNRDTSRRTAATLPANLDSNQDFAGY